MKYVFLNPNSCSGLGRSKWDLISSALPELKDVVLIDEFYDLDWKKLSIQQGDSFYSAGGDGTIHSMVNALILHKGLETLKLVGVGHIGIGSNNSFLRPYHSYQSFKYIPYALSEKTYEQDLIKVRIDQSQDVICVANSSLGFLASANEIFNTHADVAKLKRINPDLADTYTVMKTLKAWNPIEVTFPLDGELLKRKITNMHFMKKPFYASDLRFPEDIPSDNGTFALQVLYNLPKRVILQRFISIMLFKKYEKGRDVRKEVSEISIEAKQKMPLEIDGEIYWGKRFEFKILPKGINLCL